MKKLSEAISRGRGISKSLLHVRPIEPEISSSIDEIEHNAKRHHAYVDDIEHQHIAQIIAYKF